MGVSSPLLAQVVKATAPYSSQHPPTQELTTNDEDSVQGEEEATSGVDPFMEYALDGDSVADGLFGWLAFGINSTESSTVTPTAFYYKDGGVTNPDSGMGGPGGSGSGRPGGNGTPPS